MRSKASVGAHPIHPMLVVVPLGALPTALVFDLLDVWIPSATWRAAGLVANVVGVAGIAAAIVPGYVDYRWSVPKGGAAQAVARAHMGLGLGLLGFFTLLLAARWAASGAPTAWAAWAVAGASALGNLGLVAQGFLGGELRARHRIGVDSTLPEAVRGTAPSAPPEAHVPPAGGPYSGGGAPGAP